MFHRVCLVMHRWAGLALAVVLVVEGLTGSALAFRDEVDIWLNPDLFVASTASGATLDAITLRDQAEASDPHISVDFVRLDIRPGANVALPVSPRIDPVTKAPFPVHYDQLFIDPYTGRRIGERLKGEASLSRKNIVGFLDRLHRSFAFPRCCERTGALILGLAAFVWTIDCVVSFCLTLPLTTQPDRQGQSLRSACSTRWSRCWRVNWKGGRYRIGFDLHRALGLWTWGMLFVFAWSATGFNLPEVYNPVMSTLFGAFDEEANRAPPEPVRPLGDAPIDWRKALGTGQTLLAMDAERQGCSISKELSLVAIRETGEFGIEADAKCNSQARLLGVIFSSHGNLIQSGVSGDNPRRPASKISDFLARLHMAMVFGLPMRIFVCAMGLVVSALSVTGVYIWLRKRRGRFRSRSHSRVSTRQPQARVG